MASFGLKGGIMNIYVMEDYDRDIIGVARSFKRAKQLLKGWHGEVILKKNWSCGRVDYNIYSVDKEAGEIDDLLGYLTKWKLEE